MFRPLALLLVGLTACGGPEIGFPPVESAQTDFAVGGAVFVDVDGDGRPGAGDVPVAAMGAPLDGVANNLGEVRFVDEPNTVSTATQADGSFILNYRVRPNEAGIRLSLDAPLAGTEVVGQLSIIVPLEQGSMQNAVPLAQLPQDCSPDPANEAATEGERCGRLLPPDLMPIMQWDQVDPAARARLESTAGATEGFDPILPPETWFLEVDEAGRTLLRFSSVTANIGEGPLDIISSQRVSTSSERTTTETWQRIWTDKWNYQDSASGDFVFHDGHDHIHFDAFERYRLLDDEGLVIAESAKVSFCLRDSLRVSDEPAPTTGIFGPAGECGELQQAINPGYADHYNQFLPDQWIDVSGVAAGTYTVEITVDPLEVIIEADETNNSATFEVVIGEP